MNRFYKNNNMHLENMNYSVNFDFMSTSHIWISSTNN